MSTRSRSPQKRKDQQRFAIRVRFKQPEEGWGKRFDQMYDWLRLRVGSDNFAWHSDRLPGMDATAVYLNDIEVMREFVSVFGVEVAEWKLA